MIIRIELPKAADLDTSIRNVRAMFDKVETIYYPKKDIKRKGIGEFMFLDPIKKWDFISTWCEVQEGEGNEPMCEISAVPQTAKQFGALVKLFPDLLDSDYEFSFSQTIRHKDHPDFHIDFFLVRTHHGYANTELSIEERWPRKKKFEPAILESKFKELWTPICEQLCEYTQLTITPSMSGTKFRATKSNADFRVGKVDMEFATKEEVLALMAKWAKLISKLPKNLEAHYSSFFGNCSEAQTLKTLLKLRRHVDAHASIHFWGKYRKDFRIESLMGTYPVEGYWRLPLFRATAGKVGSYFDADLILTPNGNFVEYPIDDKNQLEKLKSHKKFKGRFTAVNDAYGRVV